MSDGRPWQLLIWPGPTSAGAPRFLLVHGLGATPAYFQPLAIRLAQDGVVYAPNLPGFGGTMRLPGTQSTSATADALAKVCTELGSGPYVVVGHSLGCQVVVSLVARHPTLAAGLVLLSPAPDPSEGPLLCQAVALAIDVPREPSALLKLMIPAMVSASPRYLLTSIRAMTRYSWTEDLGRIPVPTLVIRGGRDPLVSCQWGEMVTRMLPNARLIEVPGAPHGVNFTDAATIAQAIRNLVGGV
jgi:pimeloyl-ACP methyl ester carboxylesterase